MIRSFYTFARRCLLAGACLGLSSLAWADASPAQTVITSKQVEMLSGVEQNRFYFEGDVEVAATNLQATCDTMEVVALRAAASESQTQMGTITRILMRGNVRIEQAGRTATAQEAEVLPHQGRVVLSGEPVVTDGEGTVTGWKMVLHQDQKRVEVLSDPEAAEGAPSGRTRITLPAVPDLGYTSEQE